MDALVADAHRANSVAGIRALARAGVHVHAHGPSRAAAGRWSRLVAGREAGDLGAAIARRAPTVVYPGEEATIDELLRLPRVREAELPWDPGSLAPLRSKRRLPELARAHGLDAPATTFDGRAGELAGAGVPLPAVVKPAGAVGALGSARVAADAAGLAALARELPADEPVLAQPLVRGRLLSLALVLDREGRVVAGFQEEVERTWPLAAGSFAATVSVAVDPSLVERAGALLRAAGYWGLAQLDVAEAGGAMLLLDVNPRFYACMPLALACGVNLPAAWHAVVTGEGRAEAPGSYALGRRYRWLEGDLFAARHGELRRLRGPRGDVGAMWAAGDPLPSLLLALAPLREALARRRPARGAR